MTIIAWLQDLVAHNQVFSGVAGVSLIGGVLYWLRALPARFLKALTWSLSMEVEVSNDSEVFDHLVRWMAQRATSWHTRNLKLAGGMDSNADRPPSIVGDDDRPAEWFLAPGRGSHCIWFDRWPYFLRRDVVNEKQTNSSRVREVIWIRTPGISRVRVEALLGSLKRDIVESRTLNIFVWRMDYWSLLDKRRPRSTDTVILRGGVMESLIDDIGRFMDAFDWYAARGVPYRRGYLLYGPPGTGKSSTAVAVAGHFKLPVYVLNLGSIYSDGALINAVSQVPSRSILLIEDIDAAMVKSRQATEDEKKDEEGGITLSALLNCLDGAMAREGRILIMTTNYPGRVDAALVRPGRVDVKIAFDLAGPAEAASLFLRFFPDRHDLVAVIRSGYGGGQSQADIQAVCLSHADADAAARALIADSGREAA